MLYGDGNSFNPVETIIDKLDGAIKTGNCWTARCPAHDDRHPSLSIAEGDDGRALVHCFAGCSVEAIAAALGLSLRDLMPSNSSSRRSNTAGLNDRIATTYDYTDERGSLLFQAVRLNNPKSFRQRRRDGHQWVWSLTGVRRVLYRLPELLAADPGETVFLCEGEKDVNNLAALGLIATTCPMGAGKWRAEYNECLRGRHVVVLPDNDEPGRAHARTVADSLIGVAATVRIVDLPGLPPKGDVSDWITAGGTADTLRDLAAAAPLYTNDGDPPDCGTNGNAADPQGEPWPAPIPLTATPDVPPFPAELLPDTIRRWALAVAEELQVPVDLPATLALGMISAGLGRRVVVSPRDGFTEPTNLFILTALPPGDRKTQTFRRATEAVVTLERELVQAALPAIQEAESRQRVADKRVKHLEEKISRVVIPADAADLNEQLTTARRELQEAMVPPLPVLLADDDTEESLKRELVRQGGRLLIATTEPRCLENLTRYSDKPSFDVYLKGHGGDEIRTGRIGRGRETIDRPALSCVLSPQPEIIRGLAETPALRGRGFLARWLYSLPTSRVGSRVVGAPAVPASLQSDYNALIRSIWQIDYATNEWGEEAPHVLRFDRAALAVFERFDREHEPLLAEGMPLSRLAGWANKAMGACARIAAALHVAECIGNRRNWGEPIPVSVVNRAVALCRDYYVPHALAAFDVMGANIAAAAARKIWAWIARERLTEFTRRDVFNANRAAFESADDTVEPLRILEDGYLIRPLAPPERRGAGRKPSPVYTTNPAALEGVKPNSAYSAHCARGGKGQNPPPTDPPTGEHTPAHNAQNTQNCPGDADHASPTGAYSGNRRAF